MRNNRLYLTVGEKFNLEPWKGIGVEVVEDKGEMDESNRTSIKITNGNEKKRWEQENNGTREDRTGRTYDNNTTVGENMHNAKGMKQEGRKVERKEWK